MLIFADGRYYESTVSCESHGSQQWFMFTTGSVVKYSPSLKPVVTVKYGRAIINQQALREICGRSETFYPRIFVDGDEKAGCINNRF